MIMNKVGGVEITINGDQIHTNQAHDIVKRILPEFILMFLAKNRKYAKVDNALGARGVFPDVYRKVGILKDRVWDGSPSVGEGTREVAMDLVGHLLLMIHMMDTEDKAMHDEPAWRAADREHEDRDDAMAAARNYMLGCANLRPINDVPLGLSRSAYMEVPSGRHSDDGPTYPDDDNETSWEHPVVLPKRAVKDNPQA